MRDFSDDRDACVTPVGRGPPEPVGPLDAEEVHVRPGFRLQLNPAEVADAFEVPLPASVQTAGEASEMVALTAETFRQAQYEQVPVFLEVPFSPDGLDVRPHLLAALRASDQDREVARDALGAAAEAIGAHEFIAAIGLWPFA